MVRFLRTPLRPTKSNLADHLLAIFSESAVGNPVNHWIRNIVDVEHDYKIIYYFREYATLVALRAI